MDTPGLIEALSQPSLYPGGAKHVEVRETHASAVFLTETDAYKLKKPVDFAFLDYSTLARRRRMCAREVELNRRLARGVYLGVERLTSKDGRLTLGGHGRVVDYLVHMRRLPDERMLSCLVARDAATEADLRAVARRIAVFHALAATGPAIDRFGHPRAIARNVEENFNQTAVFVDQTVSLATYAQIAGFARDFIRDNRQALFDRIAAGRIRDGHGDLRADHVYLVDGVEIIDCIEFNDRFRYADVAADIAFLAMDLDAHGAPDLADVLLGEYSKYAGDNLAPVLDFYRCYRAYTRGKVASLRAEQASIGDAGRDSALLEARRYFHLALRYARHERRPRLVLMAGLTGSGKSSLATRLGDILAARVVSSDETRKQLAGLGRWDRRLEAADSGLYAPAMNERVYAAMLAEARCQLTRGRTVILDATYRRRADREAARALAGDLQAGLLTVECAIDDVTVRQRLDARARAGDSWSDGRWEIYLHQKRAFEPLVELLPAEHVTVDTTRPAMTQVDAVLAHLETSRMIRTETP